MPVYREKNKKKWTKDGRSYFFKCQYEDAYGNKKTKKSKYYMTSKEAKDAEDEFKLSNKQRTNDSNLTFLELTDLFYEYKKGKVREGSYNTYYGHRKEFEFLFPIKINKLTIQIIDKWKSTLDEKPNLSTSYKNDVLTTLKQILNFAMNYHNFDLIQLYRKIEPFKNPDEIKKEMEFYTFNEYQQFIFYETELLYKAIFDTFYYLGLRKGELRGLQWKYIDFENHIMKLRVQIPSRYNVTDYKLTPLKTKASKRDLPIPDVLYNELLQLYNQAKQFKNFNEDWFVFGDSFPICKENIKNRKDRNLKLANLKYIRIHDFRHSCASLLITNGADITLVAKWLGHANVALTLNTYAHMYKSRLDEIKEAINIMVNNIKKA